MQTTNNTEVKQDVSLRTKGEWIADETRVIVEGEKQICECYDYSDCNDENLANAAYIVKACNAHDELVKALQDALNNVIKPLMVSAESVDKNKLYDAMCKAEDLLEKLNSNTPK